MGVILDNKEKRIQELEASMEAPGFWDDPDSSQITMKELKNLKSSFERFHELEQGIEDAQTLIEMAEEENDTSLIPDVYILKSIWHQSQLSVPPAPA